MVEHLEGKQVPKVVDTGVAIVTPENLDDPRSQELLNPPKAES
jgi:ABC-type sugar transport system substrate-binding protein